jgi:hypothetical protein
VIVKYHMAKLITLGMVKMVEIEIKKGLSAAKFVSV